MISDRMISENMQRFIDRLYERLSSSKIDSLSQADLAELQKLVYEYNFKEADWKELVFFDEHKYTRNLIYGENGNFDLLLLGWSPGQFR